MARPPFRADHVGSLLRPPELLRARSEPQAGRLSGEELRRIVDAAIRDAIRMQQEIGLEGVTDGEFRRGSVDGFFLEYDDARSGGFEPLRFVPKGSKRVVLGLVTSKRAALESKDSLKRRIDEAAKYVPLEQLCLSPQCGFSSTVDGNALTRDEQIAKLRLVVETAREVWG